MAVSKCPCSTFSNVMFKQMPRSHWFPSINSQYLQPYWLLQQTSEHTKPQRYIRSHNGHMSYFFKIAQKACRHHKKRAFGWVREQYGIMNSISSSSSSSSSLIQSIRLLCSLMQFPYRHFTQVLTANCVTLSGPRSSPPS